MPDHASLATLARAILDAWARQLLVGLALPLALGVLLTLVIRTTQRLLVGALGWKAVIYSTGWLGTPVHEGSHLLFGLPFGLRATEVKLFEPHPEDGVLGYVKWSFEPRKPHHQLGLLVSSVAPLFGGTLLLLLALRLVAPSPAIALDAAARYATTVAAGEPRAIADGFVDLVRGTYGAVLGGPLADWRPWVFLYIALAIGGHLAPSFADLRLFFPRFVFVLIALLVVDAGLILASQDTGRVTSALATASGPISALLLVALVLNVGNLALAGAVAVLRRGR